MADCSVVGLQESFYPHGARGLLKKAYLNLNTIARLAQIQANCTAVDANYELSNFRKVVISFVHYSLNRKLTKKLSKK
jgi:hypothetical protein